MIRSFARVGSFRNSNTPQATLDLGAKHLQSISDMVDYEFPKDQSASPVQPISSEEWDEKFVDAINYLFKLYACIKHERGEF